MRHHFVEQPKLNDRRSLIPLDPEHLQQGLTEAFNTFLDRYAELGGQNFHGFAGHDDDRNYKGPMIWSEGDCQFQLALELEHQFPGMVHIEVPLARYTVRDWDPVLDRRQFIDIVVSDLSAFDVKAGVFARHTHDLFVEVKFAGHSTRPFHGDSIRKVRGGVTSDLARLERNLSLGRCRAAAMLLIDDESHLECLQAPPRWNRRIRPLLASPAQLKRRQHARDEGITLPLSCPACGSPRVAPITYGMPPPELEAAAQRGELILGGCEVIGDGMDPEYGCLDLPFHPLSPQTDQRIRN